MKISTLPGTALLLSGLLSAHASDWPHLLGPTSDAFYNGPALAEEWPQAGPPIVWKIDVGEGYSSPVIAEGRLVFCHRLEDQLVVDTLDPKTGSNLWSFKHEMKFRDGASFDSGPRPTPAIKDGKVYIHNTDGYLACLDLKDGKKIWSLNIRAKFNRRTAPARPGRGAISCGIQSGTLRAQCTRACGSG